MAALGCESDFFGLASEPLDAAIPGARSLKFVLDRADGDSLYFQNSRKYLVHWEFASEHLSGRGLPVVPDLPSFNETEYYSPDRRFVLGAVTFYETSGEPGIWAFELSGYDTATAEMMELAFRAVAGAAYFGELLRFHPTSEAVLLEAERLPRDIPIVATDEIFAGIDYQPLNLATALGRLAFVRADDLEDSFVGFRDIVVLDRVPNDITVVSGIITAELQTPLSHVNVLSQNRGTPNMGLRGALAHDELRALDGKWVRLVVGAFEWSIEEVDRAEADEWWEAHRPASVQVPFLDLSA
ncbi:MAG: hypothetical protein HYZ27_12670, partial [Deltaproteobacteria bacterium]|nr:hypothetical protein [Deltaproteobacteria bacterium]